MSESTNNERDAVLAAAASSTDASSPSVGIDYTSIINIDSIVDDSGKYVGTVANGGLTDDLQPTLNGYLPHGKGIEIRVYVNNSVIGYTTVGDDGNWSFTPSTPLEAGKTYNFQVFMLNPGDGNTLLPSTTYTIITTEANQDVPADATPPDAPVIDSVVDNVAGYKGFTGNLKDGALTDDAHPALSGHAEAGTTVNIYDNGALLGSTTAAADGSWAFTPANALNDGAHTLTVTAANAAGESTPAEFSITVDTVISKPVLDAVTDNQGLEQGVVESGGLTDDSRPVLTGHAEAGSRVDIHVFGPNGKQLYYQSVTADADGSWTYQPKAFTTHGTYSFGISGVDQAGNAWTDYGDKYSVNFVGENQDVPADTTPPDAPVITAVYDNAGDSVGYINSGDTIDDTSPVLSGTAEAGSIVKIYDNGALIGSMVASASGVWGFMPSGRSEGEHIFTATATDAAGNVSDMSGGFVVNIDIPDTTPPEAPAITAGYDNVGAIQGSFISGTTTDDARPALSGHAEAGSIVKIYDNGSVIGSTTASSSGDWSFTPSARSEGKHTFTATATDAAGNVSGKSGDFVVNVDTTPPDVPVILLGVDNAGDIQGDIHSGGTTDDTTPELLGSAERGSVVKIYDGGYLIGSATTSNLGTWTFTPPARSEGTHIFTVTATDAAGNVSGRSADFVVNIQTADTTPPDAPVITSAYDDVGTVQGDLKSGATTDDATPKLSGHAEAGSVVKIYDGSALIGSAVTNASGNWSFTPSARSEGQHTFTATATDAAGNVSGKSGGFVVTIDTHTEMTITGLQDASGDTQGLVGDGGLTDDSRPVLVGTAEPGSTVYIHSTGAFGEPYNATVTVGSDGKWTLPQGYANYGTFSYSAYSVDAVGNHSATVTFSVEYVAPNLDDTTPPDAPVITTVYDDVGTAQGNVANGGLTDDGQVKISGTAEANSHVTVTAFAGGKSYLLGDVVTDADGHWSYQMSGNQNLRNILGTWTFTATATDAAGNTSGTSDPYSVQVVGSNQDDTTPPDAPVITTVYDDVGAMQGNVANGGLTDDNAPDISGTAEAGSIVTVSRIGPQNKNYVMGTAVADSHGHWTLKGVDAQNTFRYEGTYRITATAKDEAGNTSEKSADYAVKYVAANQDDTTPPDAPSITSAYDDVGTVQGDLKSGATTDDTTPKLSGHAEAGSVVKIYDGSAVIGSTTANGSGNWSFTPSARSEGQHIFTATATDAAGNVSGKSAGFVVNIDIPDTTPARIEHVIDDVGVQQGDIANGGKTDDTQPHLTGSAAAGSTVTIHQYDPFTGKEYALGTVIASANGQWEYQLTGGQVLQSGGESRFWITTLDSTGNTATSPDFKVTLVGSNLDDTTPPDAPVIQGGAEDESGTGGFVSGGTTDDTTPALYGLAEAGSVVKVYEGNTLIGSTVATSEGVWALELPERSEGLHILTATATDAAGNTSVASAGFVVNVDTTPPATSGIEQFGDASNEHGYSFTTAQGVEVTSTTDMQQGSAPAGLLNGVGGDTFLHTTGYNRGADIQIKLPGVADTVIFSGLAPHLETAVTFYDANGHVIDVKITVDSDYSGRLALDVLTATAPDGEAISSFIVHDATYIGGVKWESAGVTSHVLQQEISSTHSAEGSDDSLLLSQVEDKSHGDMANHTQDTLQLTLNDILSEAHDNLFMQDGHKQMAVTGDAGDVVELKVEDLAHNTWQDAGQVTAGGVQYEVYHHTGSDVELLVQHGVELHQVS
ncbi:Ig-like domain-containing protein [Enterobacteriaceae bacterium H11S18]|uniref:Ig-like domain-containing protein n=1 Tax=Dryocola clanedunensis TaxID=2925396 RepID=UPI0022F12D4B|nr:Ig-like domain-containing protein [Dryocola clanedunensis]MCT4709123.1 Ig-like domain-containing protein [Dryocola clanedunensis]